MRRPRFIAEQARHARGLLGRLIAFIMARETWRDNLEAIDALNIETRDHVLDVGSGHGRSLGEIAARAPAGRAAGADPSELMVEIAVARNAPLVRARRVDVAIAEAHAMPFPDGSFDKAMCVHVLYFWPNLLAACAELARVLKPGGQLALVFRTAANEAAARGFPTGVYAFPAIDDVIGALERCGFSLLSSPAAWRDQTRKPALLLVEKTGLAQPL